MSKKKREDWRLLPAVTASLAFAHFFAGPSVTGLSEEQAAMWWSGAMLILACQATFDLVIELMKRKR